jgi:hypothetical protein
MAWSRQLDGLSDGGRGVSLLIFGATAEVSTIKGRMIAAKLRRPAGKPLVKVWITKKNARPPRNSGATSRAVHMMPMTILFA